MATNNVTCGAAPVTSVGAVCSGNGICEFDSSYGRGVCRCFAGWQGESDFQVTSSLTDCQINVTAIRAMWGVALALLMVILFKFHIPHGRWLLNKHLKLVAKNKAGGKQYRLRDNKGFFSVVPYLIVGWPAMISLAIVKIVDQDLKLGQSPLVTVLYIIWRASFFFAPDIVQPALLETLLRTERNLDHIIKINWRFNIVHLVFIQLISILVIIPMAVPQDPFRPVIGMISFGVFANLICLAFISLAIQARYISHRVHSTLVTSYALTRDERTRKIMGKIKKHQHDIIRGTLIQTLIFGTFGAFPYMWNKHDYLVPISIVFSAVQVKVGLQSLVQEEDKSTSKGVASASSPSSMGEKKMAVQSNGSSSAVDTVPKEPYVHGLEFDPHKGNGSLVVSAEGSFNSLTEGENFEVIKREEPQERAKPKKISPAMRLLKSLTPTRKAQTSFAFEKTRPEDDGSA